MFAVTGNWPCQQLTVAAMSPTLYRVMTTECSAVELPLLGFVQLIGDLYETTALGDPWCRGYWASLDAAVNSLGRSAETTQEPVSVIDHTLARAA
jgi:hypothetical protein